MVGIVSIIGTPITLCLLTLRARNYIFCYVLHSLTKAFISGLNLVESALAQAPLKWMGAGQEHLLQSTHSFWWDLTRSWGPVLFLLLLLSNYGLGEKLFSLLPHPLHYVQSDVKSFITKHISPQYVFCQLLFPYIYMICSFSKTNK